MATLKDVADLAGVSIAAVSLYLNGKSRGRVSEETQHKIEQAVQESGYTPPASKKKSVLPEDRPSKTLAIFWSIDFRRNVIGQFMSGIQNAILDAGNAEEYNYILRPYKSDQLYLHKHALCSRQYHGMLIANASGADLQYLQDITPLVPTVLINRRLPGYSSVFIDSSKTGEQAAELIYEKGYRSICTVRSQSRYVASNSRFSEFIRSCREKGIQIPNEFQIVTEDSPAGGLAAAHEFLSYRNRPPMIFAASDMLASGLIKGLKNGGLLIPKDCGLFCYGFDSEERSLYMDPPLSVLDIPSYGLAYQGTRLLMTILQKGLRTEQLVELSGKIVLRDSF